MKVQLVWVNSFKSIWPIKLPHSIKCQLSVGFNIGIEGRGKIILVSLKTMSLFNLLQID